MRKCSVAGCNSQNHDVKVTLFSVTNANKSSWETAIHSSIANQVKNLKYVCLKHFLPKDICASYAIPSDVIEEFEQKKVFSLKTSYYDSSEATLTNMKSRGGLCHPNMFLFHLLVDIEDSLKKFCDGYNVFELTVDDFFNKNKN
ncbi:hypothetical protein QTP88_026563 [Uroleucon formosanum]